MGLFYLIHGFFAESNPMNQAEELKMIVLPIVESRQAFLVDIQIRGSQTGKVVELFVDSEAGVTANLCAAISSEVSKKLDSSNLMSGRYNLVVSSPGLDRPLTLLRQYRKNIGRTICVTVKNSEGAQKVTGELKAVEEGTIVLHTSGDADVSIPLDSVSKAVVETKW